MRALATVDTVTDITPIEGADRIVVAHVRGWRIVVKKGEFSPGDLCVYFEIDSFLPATDPRYSFLTERSTRTTVEGVQGHPLRTVKLRGVVSQGLAMRTELFPEISGMPPGTDVTEILNITKWEPPIPAELAGTVAGAWPGWLTKTDEERIQNTPGLFSYASQRFDGAAWEAYEKIDGASMSVFLHDNIFAVASRNRNLLETPDNSLWKLARHLNLENILRDTSIDAIQGEIFGEGIQGNPLRMRGQHYAIFDVWQNRQRIPRTEWPTIISQMSVPRRQDYEHPDLFRTQETLLETVNGMKSIINTTRSAEGVVYRHPTLTEVTDPETGHATKASFKVISNTYLLKHEQ